MRRISVIVMALTSIFVIGTGIGESDVPHTGLAGHHIVAASLFFIAACVHCWCNRKAIVKYSVDFGWRWAIVVASCLLVVLIVGGIIQR
jgi:hypothetical protein